MLLLVHLYGTGNRPTIIYRLNTGAWRQLSFFFVENDFIGTTATAA